MRQDETLFENPPIDTHGKVPWKDSEMLLDPTRTKREQHNENLTQSASSLLSNSNTNKTQPSLQHQPKLQSLYDAPPHLNLLQLFLLIPLHNQVPLLSLYQI